MALRAQPPARSPLSPGALAAGFRAALRGGDDASAWLRKRLLERYGARKALLVDSGTTALRLALAGLSPGGVGSAGGGPVALPAYSCYDIATAAQGAGVSALLYDLDPVTLSPDLDSLERALVAGARVVVVVPLYGIPVDAAKLEARCLAHGAVLVEDAAQGSGASYQGAPLGSHGSLAVLSFGRGKGWTGGGGGALLAHDDAGVAALEGTVGDLDPCSPGWRGLAGAAAQWAFGRPRLYGLPARISLFRLGEAVYREPWAPTHLPRTAAAVIRATEGEADREAEVRRDHAVRLLSRLRSASRLRPVEPPTDSRPGWLRLPALLPRGENGSAGPQDVPRQLGVYRGYPTPIHRLRPFRSSLVEPDRRFPGAESLAERLITLPTHALLQARDLESLEAWIATV